jgi:hypothetical protein
VAGACAPALWIAAPPAGVWAKAAAEKTAKAGKRDMRLAWIDILLRLQIDVRAWGARTKNHVDFYRDQPLNQ